MIVIVIGKMSLREKIGQMIMAGFPTKTISPEYERLVREYKIGNVIIFSHNVESAAQVRKLCIDLQKLIVQNTGHPAFISVDQEGGMVSRMPSDATNIPGAMAISATGNPYNAYLAGELTGRELHALGINMNLAPNMDINSNRDNPVIGVRSYGDQKEQVVSFGMEMMRGLNDGGVMSVIKHFPGHGDTAVDSHLGLPVINKTVDELMDNELVPFKAAIDTGAECVMSSHILFPAIEMENVPATMSKTIITGLLKEKLGFRGLVVSDCLEMNAIKTFYGTPNGALAAIKAGINIICVSHTAELIEETAKLIESVVLSGELPVDIIDDSVEKILKYKAKYAEYDITAEDLSIVGCAEHKKEVLRLSRESITVVRSKNGKLPKIGKETLFAGCYANRSTLASSSINKDFNFPEYMANSFGSDYVIVPSNPNEADIEKVLRLSINYNSIVLGTYNGHLNPGQIELANKLCEVNKNVVIVALRNPYDLSMIDKHACTIAVYEYTTLAFESLIEVFKGSEMPVGRLSVNI